MNSGSRSWIKKRLPVRKPWLASRAASSSGRRAARSTRRPRSVTTTPGGGEQRHSAPVYEHRQLRRNRPHDGAPAIVKTSRRALSDPDGQERPFVVCRNPWPKCLTTLVAYMAPRDSRARGSRLSRRCVEARDLFRVSRHDRRLQRGLTNTSTAVEVESLAFLNPCGVPLLMKYT